ncbi:Glutathione transport system permease protein GsiD [subsurface metagenome]
MLSYYSFKPPSLEHFFGTDALGRDIFSRVIYGSRYSTWIGFISIFISLVIGGNLGLIGGYFGGRVDNVIMRCMDVMFAFPGILLALFIAATLGPGLTNLMIALGISAVPGYARVARSSVLSVKEKPYIEAARSIGCNNFNIIFRHILPNVIAPLIVLSTMGLASRILSAAALSFIGLGAQPPTPEWGLMLSEGRGYLRVAWWMTTFPGLAIMFVVFGINILGDGLRDALDPRFYR